MNPKPSPILKPFIFFSGAGQSPVGNSVVGGRRRIAKFRALIGDSSPAQLNMVDQSSPIVIPEQWSSAAAAVAASRSDRSSSPPVVFICGAKNSGKSTFSRLLLNSLVGSYGKVGYLDTDVGQPEFTTPGCLSFHSIHEQNPDLTILSMKTPERCFFFGDISAKRDPKTYLDCVLRLYDYYQSEYCPPKQPESCKKIPLPLIINTPGWIKGIGFHIMVEMLRHMEPTHVIQIRISVEEKNLPLGEFWLEGSQRSSVALIDLYAARSDSSNRSVLTKKSGRHSRDARIIAYFRQCFPGNLSIATNKELAHAMASLPPYEVSLSDIKVHHCHCQVPSHEVFHSLNATIVGLARSSKNSEVPESSLPWCVGLGLVRAVDASKQIVYVITPVPLWHLEKVDILLQGFIEIPTCLLQVRGCISPYMSTNVISLHPTPFSHKRFGREE